MTTTEFPKYTQTKNSKTSDVSISGNVDVSGSVQMTISAEGTAHIMSLLTDLYSDPNLAVLREYASNGADSHEQAKNATPILISTPTRMSPVYVVQDFGVGMSAEEIKTIYSAYGASTKRNDFTQMGAFGLGCKAALTITQQFTLVSVKDGRKSTVLISRGDDGVGQVNVVSNIETTEPNGVTVSVPITDINAFNQNVNKFFYMWKPNTVLVNGSAPKSIFDDNFLSTDDDKIHVKNGVGYNEWGLTVIMGSVAYAVDANTAGLTYAFAHNSVERVLMNSTKVVVDVPIGSIDLTPSREDIRYSDRTKTFLSEIYAYAISKIPVLLTEKIKASTTRNEVLTILGEWSILSQATKNPLKGITWNGEEVPFSVDIEGHYYNKSRAKYNSNRSYTFTQRDLTRLPLVSSYNYRPDSTKKIIMVISDIVDAEKTIKRDSRYWAETTDHDFNDIMHVKEAPTSPWIMENDKFVIVPIEEMVTEAKKIRKDERGTRTKTAGAEFQYLVLTLVKTSTGTMTTQKKNVSYKTLPTAGFYFQTGQGYFDTYLKRFHTDAAKETLTTLLELLGLKENESIVILTASQTPKALDGRTKGTYKSVISELREKQRTMANSASKEESAYVYLKQNSYQPRRIMDSISRLEKIRDKISKDSPLQTAFEFRDKGLKFEEKTAILNNVFGHNYAIRTDAQDVIVSTEKFILSFAKIYVLLYLDSSDVSRFDSPDRLEHVIDYVNMIDKKGSK